ncbi:hypothetical protein [Actinoplanes sp. NPDC051494]|uniref:hypothetical protein n=1 Tax=Actinoplanes sp. NPDC051494 TaxID=3363907 RepID=UPI0037B64F98
MDFTEYLTDHCVDTSRLWWNYELPNGLTAMVRPSTEALRFDMEIDNPDADNGMDEPKGLTTTDVEARLTDLAAHPAEVDA